MTIDELNRDIDKFAAYLRANGMRPVAIALTICNDHTCEDWTVQAGAKEMTTEMALRVIASNNGFRLEYK